MTARTQSNAIACKHQDNEHAATQTKNGQANGGKRRQTEAEGVKQMQKEAEGGTIHLHAASTHACMHIMSSCFFGWATNAKRTQI